MATCAVGGIDIDVDNAVNVGSSWEEISVFVDGLTMT
jgi:hypothetical protein